MKKYSLYILILLFHAFLFASCHKQAELNGLVKEYYRTTSPNKLLKSEKNYKAGRLDGVARTYYADAKVETEAFYKNGLMEGVRKGYYPNGSLKFECPYVHGQREGVEKDYDQKGQIETSTEFKGNQENGFKRQYTNGKLSNESENVNNEPKKIRSYGQGEKLLSEIAFGKAANGSMNGHLRTFYLNGQVNEMIPYVNFQPEGVAQTFYENGNLKNEYHYKGGLVEGESRSFYNAPNKTIESETTFVANKASGIVKNYFESGAIQSTVIWNSGVPSGESKSYYPSGEVNMVCDYQDGALTKSYVGFTKTGEPARGKIRSLYSNGKVESEVSFNEDGKPVGIGRSFYASGAHKNTCVYDRGRPEGVFKKYYASGNLEQEQEFKSGILVAIKDYFEDGKLKSKATLENWRYEGEVIVYWPDGSVRQKANYENGEPLNQASPKQVMDQYQTSVKLKNLVAKMENLKKTKADIPSKNDAA